MKIQPIDGNMAWAIICYSALKYGEFKSVSGIKYQFRIDNDVLYYNGGKRNKGEDETITKKEFITAFESIKILNDINTNAIKTIIPSSLYRKRTPVIGLLLSAGIII